MEITAEVAEKPSEPTYTVTVPSAVSMGTLSSEAENKQAYDVTVKAADLNGTLSVKSTGKRNFKQRKKIHWEF